MCNLIVLVVVFPPSLTLTMSKNHYESNIRTTLGFLWACMDQQTHINFNGSTQMKVLKM